jgi:hypothetical protein
MVVLGHSLGALRPSGRSVRFCAVTTISSSATSASGLALPWADASEETAINTPARIVAGIFAANAGTSGFFS